ncbi:MAG: hypothetical protein ACLR78_06890 [Roseburia sp.]
MKSAWKCVSDDRAGDRGKRRGLWRRWKRQRQATNSKSPEVSEYRRKSGDNRRWGTPPLGGQTDIMNTAASTGKPGTDRTETAAASGAVEEAVPPTSAELRPTPASVWEKRGSDEQTHPGQGRSRWTTLAAAANGYRIYEIGDGETLYGICWKEY